MKEFEGQLALSNLRLEVAQAQLVKANEEGEHQRLLIAKLEDRLEQEQKEIREERKELREERKELREDLKAHRQGFADQISKMEQRLEQERKEHRDERARMQDEYEARIAKLEERLAKAVV
ncbi:hypothetical protein L227DRAFT_301465 [Lentinus tigrinus ALCF2SS1-6]|uniref:Uncharacterized protein n=2 Tax=Lentinus tigrinus TaxID=5365 RepID=A0A5C2RWZ5_9APHY|nr:hypothetical protein L227DRAFT_301465 [Lentinus tigrinus ALCF2SS1-6]